MSRAALLGSEFLFSPIPEEISGEAVAKVQDTLSLEGFEVSFPRLEFLFRQGLQERRERIGKQGREMRLEEIVDAVLGCLEIDAADIRSQLTEQIARHTADSIVLLDGASAFLSRLKDLGFRIALLWNAPIGIPPRHISYRMEELSILPMLDEVQYSSENGYVRPHAMPLKYALSNLGSAPREAVAFTGIAEETSILSRLGIAHAYQNAQGLALQRFNFSDMLIP